MMPEQPYLRPAFTRMLAERLLHGSNINLSAAHGQGRRQTLKDLRHALPDSLQIHQFDARRDHADPLNWLEACALHCDQTHSAQTHSAQTHNAQTHNAQTLFILHNFNEIPQGERTHMFLDRLIRLCSGQEISLLCITECEEQNVFKLESFQLPPLSEVSQTEMSA